MRPDSERGKVVLSHRSAIMSRAVSFLTIDKKGRATLPEEVRSALGVEAGDLILLERTDRGTFELVPATLVPREQLWFHHPEMQARVGRAKADVGSPAKSCWQRKVLPMSDAHTLLLFALPLP